MPNQKISPIPQVSIIISCYNEQDHLENSVIEIERVMKQTSCEYEFIFIEDYSDDNTAAVIRKIVTTRPNAKTVWHKKNVGRGGSVKEGLMMASGHYAGFLDIDLEVPAHYIPVMLRVLDDGSDMVCANRIESIELKSLVRLILSRGYKWLAHFTLKINTPDSEAGYKFFNLDKMRSVIITTQNQHWFWDTEIIYRAEKVGMKISSIPMVFTRRPDKKSTVKLIPDTISFLKSLWKFKRQMRAESTADSRSIIYRHVWLYRAVMVCLYGRVYWQRFHQLANYIPNNASLVELCAGPGDFYLTALQNKNITYRGFDFSSDFVKYGFARGVNLEQADILNMNWPLADYYVMNSSLCHFHPNAEKIIQKMLSMAQQGVLIMEPIKNMMHSKNRFLAGLARKFTNDGKSSHLFRFDENSLKELTDKYFSSQLVETKLTKNKRERILVLKQ